MLNRRPGRNTTAGDINAASVPVWTEILALYALYRGGERGGARSGFQDIPRAFSAHFTRNNDIWRWRGLIPLCSIFGTLHGCP